MTSSSAHEFGSQEAAHRLNIHRSTLFLAVKRGLLVPDRITPRGHYRFRQETLDAYSERLRMQAATSNAEVTAPVRILAPLSRALSTQKSVHVCQEAVNLLCDAPLGIDMACVAMWRPKEGDEYGARLLAERGWPSWFFPTYRRARPQVEFATNRVLRTREPIVCADTQAQGVRQSRALWIVQRANIRSYAVLPMIIQGNGEPRLLGALVTASTAPHEFVPDDMMLLQAVADLLAIALGGRPPMNKALACVLEPDVARLTQQVFALAAEPDDGTLLQVRAHDLFLRETGAVDMCVYGFGEHRDVPTREPMLIHMARKASKDDGLFGQQWYDDNEEPFTTLAASIPLGASQRGAVAATWSRQRTWDEAEHSLLVSFAAAYTAVGSMR